MDVIGNKLWPKNHLAGHFPEKGQGQAHTPSLYTREQWQVFTTFCSHVHSREGRRYIGDMQRILENPRSVCPRKALHKHPLIAIRPERACLSRDVYIVLHSIHLTVFVSCPFRRRRSLKHSEGVSLRVSPSRCRSTPSRCTHCNWGREWAPVCKCTTHYNPMTMSHSGTSSSDAMQMQAVEKCGCKQPNLPWFANLSEVSFITKRGSLHVPNKCSLAISKTN